LSKIRIIGGTHRSRQIEVAESTGLRPTPDRVRETLFNWLGQDLEGLSCLDLFAGSGALGLEAASRGAERVVMVESAPKVLAHLRQAQTTLGAQNVRIVAGDAIKFAASATERFDVLFLDPPYRQGWLERLEPHLHRLLAPDARIYVESENAVARLGDWVSVKSGRAGQVHYQLLAAPDSPAPQG
jgi:16S rRNA (guanine966-N2)-methyltransferase